MDTVKLLVLYLASRLLLEIAVVNSNVQRGSNRVTFFIFPFSKFKEITRVVSTFEPPNLICSPSMYRLQTLPKSAS